MTGRELFKRVWGLLSGRQDEPAARQPGRGGRAAPPPPPPPRLGDRTSLEPSQAEALEAILVEELWNLPLEEAERSLSVLFAPPGSQAADSELLQLSGE